MSNSKSLIQSTLVYTVGNFGSKILSFLLIPLYSYFLSKSELGTYDLVLTSVQLLLPIVSMQMNEAVYRWLLDCGDNMESKKVVLKNTITIMFLTFVIVQMMVQIGSLFIHIPYLKEFSILLLTSSFLPFSQQIVRGLGLKRVYSFAGILNSFCIFSFSIVFLLLPIFEDKILAIFYSLILANSVTIFFVLFKTQSLYKGFFARNVNVQESINMVRYSFPLVLNSLSWWLINASDRYIILDKLTIEHNGIFAISARLPSLLTIVNSVFMLAWQDVVISGKKEDSQFYSKVFNRYIAFNIGFTIILIAASPIITYLLFDHKFYESWKYAPLLYVGSCFSSLSGFLGAIYLKAKQTKGILTTSIIAALTNVGISYGLISYIGLYACALGSFASFILMFFLRYRQTLSMLTLSLNGLKFSLLLIISIVFILILLYYQSIEVSIILTVLSFVIFVIFNKDIFTSLISKIKNK